MYQYLEEEYDKLKKKIYKMGSLVEEQIQISLQSLFEGNIELASSVIQKDKKVDKYDVKIDKICQRILALTQPVAVDLRMILSALSINTNFERIGDIAVNIAEKVEVLKDHLQFLKEINLESLAENTKISLKNTLDSLINIDVELAYKVISFDSTIDKLYNEIFEAIAKKIEKEKQFVEAGLNALLISSNLERLSDHCTNIAEEVIFLSEAKIIKHKRFPESEQSGTEENPS
ncbi:MAG: phosphate signaling complex protein PhoU [Ignavibacteria bacterium]|nr:phosphate signaling complex protein PhoU [Ignavibacteria bacterium]